MSKKRNREVRYHSIFWLTYLLLWGARDMVFYPALLENMALNLILTLPVVPFVYFNLYFLLPKFLLRRRWSIYVLVFFAGLFAVTSIRYYLTQYIFLNLIGTTEAAEKFYGWNGLVIIASECLILAMITMALFLVREWYIKERYTRELEQKNAESELNMLKAQLQPHFLFNNLNTIYFLMETNPTLAKEVMIQFSDVLSHQLYNAKKDKVPLKEELESLENYLKIQRIRHEDFLELKYEFPRETGQFQIAPMILLTFIENAFKHSQKEEGYQINIDVKLDGDKLHLHVENTDGHVKPTENSGVGLSNVKRRLDLIYPDRHQLAMEDDGETYTVDLTMTLERNG